MLHGLRSYAYTWEPAALPLLPHWRVIALDQRGRGHSDWDPQRNYFADAYVRDLEALVDGLSLQRFVLVGHSMGGANALVYASRHQDRLSALVVEDMGPGASAAGRGADRIKRELRETPSSFTSWEEATAFWRKIRPDVSATALQSRATHSLKEEKSGRIVWRYDAEGIGEARLSARPEQVVDCGHSRGVEHSDFADTRNKFGFLRGHRAGNVSAQSAYPLEGYPFVNALCAR